MVSGVMGVLVLQAVSQVPQSLMPEVVVAVEVITRPLLVLEALVVLGAEEMALLGRLLPLEMEQPTQVVGVGVLVLILAHMPMVVAVAVA
tara:strand:- start:69 stop:338 length:270 start_codon:yes stop_codon:yes gene_type:complete